MISSWLICKWKISLFCIERCSSEDLARHHGEQFLISDRSQVTDVHYEYTLILGESITQRETEGSGTYFLGNYASVENGTEFYRNGDGDRGCPDGIQRESRITFVQGEEPELIEASEPSICSYEFVFQINCKAGMILFLQLLTIIILKMFSF